MILHLEIAGWTLRLELAPATKPSAAEGEADRPPFDVPTPMVVYPDPPTDPLGFHATP